MKAPQKVSKNIWIDLLRRLAKIKIWRFGLPEIVTIIGVLLLIFKYFRL